VFRIIPVLEFYVAWFTLVCLLKRNRSNLRTNIAWQNVLFLFRLEQLIKKKNRDDLEHFAPSQSCLIYSSVGDKLFRPKALT